MLEWAVERGEHKMRERGGRERDRERGQKVNICQKWRQERGRSCKSRAVREGSGWRTKHKREREREFVMA